MGLIWAWLGNKLGMFDGFSTKVSDSDQPSTPSGGPNTGPGGLNKRMDLDFEMEKLISTDDGNWLKQLEERISDDDTFFPGSRNFICCLAADNNNHTQINEVRSSKARSLGSHENKLHCYAAFKVRSLGRSETPREFYTRKIARLKSVTKAMRCKSVNLAYEVTINKKKPNE